MATSLHGRKVLDHVHDHCRQQHAKKSFTVFVCCVRLCWEPAELQEKYAAVLHGIKQLKAEAATRSAAEAAVSQVGLL